jgi:pimeloyl-ACP methyl ester carboxylesterase
LPLPAKYAYVDGTAVHYVHAGRTTLPGVVPPLARGELIVFLHDAGGNAGVWRHVAAALENAHSTIAFDFPGHGRSGGTEGLGSIDAYARHFLALARTLQQRPAVLVGHGMGAAVAVEAARRAPDSVRALVLVGAATRIQVAEETLRTWESVMRGRAPQPFTTEAFSPKTDFGRMREAWAEQIKTDPRVRYSDLLACANHDAGAAAATLRVPTLIVAGSDDSVVSPEASGLLQRSIRESQLTVVGDGGHMLPLEKTTEVAAAIAEFLSRSWDL